MYSISLHKCIKQPRRIEFQHKNPINYKILLYDDRGKYADGTNITEFLKVYGYE